MSIQQQAEQVARVKRYENGTVLHPTTIDHKATITDLHIVMKEYNISGIPVVDEEKKLVGIVTKRDLRFETDMNKPIVKVMTKKVVTAPHGTSIDEAKEILQKHRIEKLPIVNNEQEVIGLITFKDIMQTVNYPHACKDINGCLRV
jgi:IMP dehydrogenase